MSYTDPISKEALDDAIADATTALLNAQKPDGHWVFELEADTTIPAEYVLMRHYLGEPVDAALEARIATYLRARQAEHGGWPLFQDGDFDMSASVKAYFALKMIGDNCDQPHMQRARDAIRVRGGAENANVFTKILLALFGNVSWRCVPVMPVEIILLPRWFPFHMSKISYWARTVIAPLLVLGSLKPRARNPLGTTIGELFLADPQSVGMAPRAPHQKWLWFWLFRCIDVVLRTVEPRFPAATRQRAIDRTHDFVTERLNGEHGLGAIFPAMVNAVLMYDALGTAAQHPNMVAARSSIDRLLVERVNETYCQPCVSPVWDTVLTAHALMEVQDEAATAGAINGLDWLKPRQILDVKGDWSIANPALRPGGWAFQYVNPYYPDLDDTAVIVMAMDRAEKLRGNSVYETAIERGAEWICGLQSANGGWGAFDADNNYHYLDNIPFSDHGALLDPPTEDLTARCVSMLGQLEATSEPDAALARGLEFLRGTQRADGSWFGRWGMNYIYGTWSVLCALNSAGLDGDSPEVKRAVEWLLSIQNADGGWGEDGTSYKLAYAGHEPAPSTASQTAWAVLGLMAAGQAGHASVGRGIQYLIDAQGRDGFWAENRFTAVGFPRVFYLRYHGYPKFFPLWALARYRNLLAGRSVRFGM